ncbi:MAG TPA: cytochrome c biogenesis protein CcsA [Flavisolibacter sp.]|nr:cytochrome c biogenesis protein CcsA [Flavisolibacter sp.]
MDFLDEHLLPGSFGHFFLLLSLISSIGATVFYAIGLRKGGVSSELSSGTGSAAYWKRLARLFFVTEAVSVFAAFGILAYIISNHYFEYKYAWQHSSLSLEPEYLLACLWESQEGSFLLWSAWHCVLGLIFIRKQKQWEAPVMMVIGFAQVLLATMLLGVDILGLKLGSNPFLLLRNSGVLDNAPMLHEANGALRVDYLSLIKDGNDLNPLLQNYWMVIHPPVLFLGFASTIIPFAFVIGGLITRQYSEWTKAALPWALFSAAVFGLGIMMGAAWAYESLSFGGYWAWDPVENASLVPWLILVAGIHTLVIYRSTGNALRTTSLFLILAFLFVLYSTYLTRSGELQDTSVHAFTGEGITLGHQRFFLFVFVLPALALFAIRYKKIPFIAKEEEASSREFWMFVGSLVLFLSATLIIAMTSIPVFNKIQALFTGKDKLLNPLAMGEDSEYAYNRVQIFVAIVIGLLTGFGMYLRYKSTGRPFLKKLLLPSLAGLVIAALVLAFGDVNYTKQGIGYQAAIWVAVVAAIYSAVANASYIFTGLKARLKMAGGAISHVGFALILVGILISSSKKEILSYYRGGIPAFFGEKSEEKPGENVTLVKGVRTDMGKYWVTYEKDSAHAQKPLWYYFLKFESKDGKEEFYLKPNAFVNYKGNQGLMANPDAKHYLTADIFTYITSLADPTKVKDTASFKAVSTAVGDSFFYSKGYVVLEKIETERTIPGLELSATDSASIATLKVQSQMGTSYTMKSVLVNKGGVLFSQPDTITSESLILQIGKVDGNKAEFGMKESDAVLEYVTIKSLKFPFINILWAGTIIMILGMVISVIHRRGAKKEGARERKVVKKQPEDRERAPRAAVED